MAELNPPRSTITPEEAKQYAEAGGSPRQRAAFVPQTARARIAAGDAEVRRVERLTARYGRYEDGGWPANAEPPPRPA